MIQFPPPFCSRSGRQDLRMNWIKKNFLHRCHNPRRANVGATRSALSTNGGFEPSLSNLEAANVGPLLLIYLSIFLFLFIHGNFFFLFLRQMYLNSIFSINVLIVFEIWKRKSMFFSKNNLWRDKVFNLRLRSQSLKDVLCIKQCK